MRKVVLDYVLSWYTWDPARFKRALHPRLAKRMLWPDKNSRRSTLIEYRIPGMVRMLKGPLFGTARPRSREDRMKGASRWNGYIKILDCSDDICTVKTRAIWGIDYIHLAKWNGKWKIINVLWKYVPELDG
ncbi:MAG: nuclear transport factor 2 family protein [Thermoplasmata archaeon]